MAKTLCRWPAWPEFGDTSLDGLEDPDFLAVKQAIFAEYGVQKLTQSWLATCKELQQVTDEIIGNRDIIPVFSGPDLLQTGFTDEQISKVKRTGCFVVKEVVPKDETTELYTSLNEYISDNRAQIKGWPEESPSMLMLYDSPVQNAIRAHPNQLQLQRMLNELWHGKSEATSTEPLIYLYGIRDRPPQQPFLGLGPHVDAGSLCRWADPAYRRVYDRIFGGEPDKHDPWDLRIRVDAKLDLFPGPAHSTILRTFQGWTALTRTAPNEGTILCLTYVPTMEPGDTVWWHTDVSPEYHSRDHLTELSIDLSCRRSGTPWVREYRCRLRAFLSYHSGQQGIREASTGGHTARAGATRLR
jgi:hypothetical protein